MSVVCQFLVPRSERDAAQTNLRILSLQSPKALAQTAPSRCPSEAKALRKYLISTSIGHALKKIIYMHMEKNLYKLIILQFYYVYL